MCGGTERGDEPVKSQRVVTVFTNLLYCIFLLTFTLLYQTY